MATSERVKLEIDDDLAAEVRRRALQEEDTYEDERAEDSGRS